MKAPVVKAPVVELRNLKYAEFASEETNCFRASLYIDGKRRGEVSNDGRGGCHFFTDREAEALLDAFGKTQPPEVVKAGDQSFELPVTGESIVDGLLSAALLLKDFRRAIKGKVLFTQEGKAGIYQTRKLPPDALAALLANPKVKLPQAKQILNLLPEAEAMAIYKSG